MGKKWKTIWTKKKRIYFPPKKVRKVYVKLQLNLLIGTIGTSLILIFFIVISIVKSQRFALLKKDSKYLAINNFVICLSLHKWKWVSSITLIILFRCYESYLEILSPIDFNCQLNLSTSPCKNQKCFLLMIDRKNWLSSWSQ